MKDVVVIGGPNGAGKTTAAPQLLPMSFSIREFVNADEIARGLSPFNPQGSAVAAGRVMLDRIRALVEAGESFAFETTCAGRGYARLLRACRHAGYRSMLIFLWLPSVNDALTRVARRVKDGGHGIPDDVVRRRYAAGLRNMHHVYLPLVDFALIYDNSDDGRGLIAAREPGARLTIHDETRWHAIEEATR
jgi:predicted ABC-type ATPase